MGSGWEEHYGGEDFPCTTFDWPPDECLAAFKQLEGDVLRDHIDVNLAKLRASQQRAQPRQPSDESLSLGNEKKQCEELGFTPGTEKFGECVLTLSK